MKYDPRRCLNAALRQKVVLSRTVKTEFVGDALCKWSYLFPQPQSCISVTHSQYGRGLIKTLTVGSSPLREVMGAEHATFWMYREPLFILKHVL